MPNRADFAAFFRKLEQRDKLSDEERDALFQAADRDLVFPAQTDLVTEGARPGFSTLLVSGFAMRYRIVGNGQRQITAFHVPGDFVDLHSFLLKEMDHSVGACSTCRVVTFPHPNLERITERLAHLTRLLWLMTLVDGSIHREWLVAMGRRTAKNQLAHLFCELNLRLNVAGIADNDSFTLPITQADLGDALGLSTVHVNRVLQQLRADKLISWEGEHVRILDRKRLEEIAEFDPLYLHLNSEPR